MGKNEIWKQYRDTNYEVSNLGNVRSLGCNYKRWNGHFMIINKKYSKKLRKEKTHDGYYRITMYINRKPKHIPIHRMVAETFIQNKSDFKCMPYEDKNKVNIDKLEINHKNEDKTDNRVENLEWCTTAYNLNYGRRLEKSAIKHRKPVMCINTGEKFSSIREASKIFDIPEKYISDVCNGRIKTTRGLIWIKI